MCIVIRILYLNLYNMPCMRIFLKYNVQWTKYDRIDILLVCYACPISRIKNFTL